MNKRRTFIITVAIAVTVAICSSLFTLYVRDNMVGQSEIKISGEEYDTLMKYFELNDIMDIVDKYYYKDVDQDVLLEGAMKGMVASLEDRYSAYYTKDEFKAFNDKYNGSYIGLGMSVTTDTTGYIKVVRVYANGPAYEVEIKENDLITKINDTSTKNMDLDAAVNEMRGADGSHVKLTIKTGEKTREVDVVCKTIENQVVFTDMPTADIGYITVLEFSGKSVEDFEKALNTVKDEGAKSLIIDLRGNPGGFMSHVTKMADMMLNGGMIVYTKNKQGEKNTWEADKNIMWEGSTIILVDGNTASAAEVFSAALRDNGRAKLVGTQTYGKGVVQTLKDIPQTGAGVKITSSIYYTPKDEEINGKGLTPDYVVEQGAATDDATDAQLQKAISLLQGV